MNCSKSCKSSEDPNFLLINDISAFPSDAFLVNSIRETSTIFPLLFWLLPVLAFKCKNCRGKVSNVTIPEIDLVDINGEEIEKIRFFCYLGDFIEQSGGCLDVITARIRSASTKFRELLPIFVVFFLKTRGYAYNACVRMSYCMPVKRGLQHRNMSPVSIAKIWSW